MIIIESQRCDSSYRMVMSQYVTKKSADEHEDYRR